jgi:UDP-glucose 4-epimerase
VLVTGANGFLGRRLVAAFLARDTTVRALLRPATAAAGIGWPDAVEVARADLRSGAGLADALRDVDAVVHLAACVAGDDEERFVNTVVGTERLLEAMKAADVSRLVLASSFSVYDWSRVHGELDENAPLLAGRELYARDGYAVAKAWQEKIARRTAEEQGWDLRVLRPGFIWGHGNADLSGIGQRVGPLDFVFGIPGRVMPLTHVDNCADCFASVALDPRAAGETFNVVDDSGVSAWRYCRDFAAGSGQRSLRIAVPYRLAYGLTRLAEWASRLVFGPTAKLPSILVPCRFEARFKPLRFSNRRLRERLDWSPGQSYDDSLAKTFAT